MVALPTRSIPQCHAAQRHSGRESRRSLGLAFALGNFGAVSMMVLVLFAFALPGVQDWPFLPEQPLFGIDASANEHDRIVGPIAGIWLVLFILPVLLFTPDGQSSGVTWRQARALAWERL